MGLFGFGKKEKVNDLKAILTGKVIPIEQVPDETFAGKLLGDGIAFEPENDCVVVAPAPCTVISASEDMKHACGIQLDNGLELLIHIGIDTVDMNGDGFEILVKEGQKVKTGTPLVRFDAEKIKAAGHPATTMLIITDAAENKNITFDVDKQVTKAETTVCTFE